MVIRYICHHDYLPDLRMSRQIFTNEHDIKHAINQPTGYAIYNSLLKIRDPETWQRVFEPTTTYAHLGTITSTSQRHVPAPMGTFLWLIYKIGRGLRFMLAVPDDQISRRTRADIRLRQTRSPTSLKLACWIQTYRFVRKKTAQWLSLLRICNP